MHFGGVKRPMSDKLTEDKFLDAINTIYAGFNLMHLKTTEISYDERLDSNVSVICKPFMHFKPCFTSPILRFIDTFAFSFPEFLPAF